MESDPRAQLRLIERAEASPFVDYRPTPTWMAFAAGIWAATPVALVWLDVSPDFGGKTFTVAGVVLLMLAGLVCFRAWSRGYYGFRAPKPWAQRPREIWVVYACYLTAVALMIGLIWVAWLLAGPVAALVTAAVVGFVLIWGYDRAYARQALKVRARLGGGV